jgi:hypothetical protein
MPVSLKTNHPATRVGDQQKNWKAHESDADAKNQPEADTTHSRVENFKRAQIEKSTHKSFLSVGVLAARRRLFWVPRNFAFYRRLFYYTAARALQLARDEFMRYLACSSGGGTARFPQRNWRVVCPECIRTPSSLFCVALVCVRAEVCVMLAGK